MQHKSQILCFSSQSFVQDWTYTLTRKVNPSSVEFERDLMLHSPGDTILYQLTAAVPAGAANYINFNIAALDHLLTFWNLMAYDYAGPWSSVSDDQANLYRGKTKHGIDTDSSLKWYFKNGATRSKMNVGCGR